MFVVVKFGGKFSYNPVDLCMVRSKFSSSRTGLSVISWLTRPNILILIFSMLHQTSLATISVNRWRM